MSVGFFKHGSFNSLLAWGLLALLILVDKLCVSHLVRVLCERALGSKLALGRLTCPLVDTCINPIVQLRCVSNR